ncbi:DUF6492 family protein [Bradyrhizobium yuanmingense]|uniref:DUF6492 family protein n=1 Tax=Bradyrhizobium yuanmingense TaxID=108015 RepID=UPI0023BA3D99|nr:DUF6492 family protein [Bradyrhizobium yuanmingense]MDF0581267.1 DUF6492 family protein [Bradyrhizobium yuanmingense]
MHSVALLTASYAKDIERFSLLSASIDTWLKGYTRHYVLVNDEDVALFEHFRSDKRVIVPASRYLPKWLWALPAALQFGKRRVWLSLLSSPVHGWHIQQILKIAGVLHAPERRVCILDSDNLFFREFDIGRYAGGEKTPLYFAPKAVSADSPVHGVWMRTVDQLLGVKGRSFPADDYVGNALVWDRDTVRAMTEAIHSATGMNWMLAMCRKKKFSEYLLYGHFVAGSPAHLAEHLLTKDSIAVSHWDDTSLDRSSIEAMMRTASPAQSALCIQSYSSTSIEDIREVLRLSERSGFTPSLVPD